MFVAEQLEAGVEFYIGAKRDATFGTVVIVGLGGRMLEIMNQTASLVMPFDRDMARDAIRRSGAERFLSGYRGGPVADIDGLAELIVRVGALANSIGDQLEVLDLNPVFVTPSNPAGRIADIRIILRNGDPL